MDDTQAPINEDDPIYLKGFNDGVSFMCTVCLGAIAVSSIVMTALILFYRR